MTEDRRGRLIALAVLAAVPALLFIDVLFGVNGFFAGDVVQFFYPAKKVLREIVLSGQFPHWNPAFSAGQPMAANPEHEVFYPLTWLILLPDYALAYQLLTLLHVLLATFTMYALLRSMAVGRPASCFGGLSLGIGGLFCGMVNVLPILFSMAWLPLTCLYTRRFLLHGRISSLAGAVLGLAMQLLIGEPITALQTGMMLGCYAIYRGSRDGGLRTISKRVGAVALISIIALFLAAVQALPAFDHLRDSGRGTHGIAFDTVRMWSTPPLRFAEPFYPHILGHSRHEDPAAYWGSSLYGEKRIGFYSSLYSGLAVAVLALAGVISRVRGWTLVLTVIGLSGILAAGHHTPLLRALFELGVASYARYPEKFLMLGVFAAVVFSAHVLDALLRQEERVKRAAIAVAIGASAIAFVAAMSATTTVHTSLFRALFRIESHRPIDAFLTIARNDWLLAGLRGVLLVFLFKNAGWARRAAWLTLFGTFVLVDLAVQLPNIAPRISMEYFREAPATARRFPENRDEFRIFHLANWQTGSRRERLYSRVSPAYDWILQNSLAPRQPASYGLRTVIDGDYDETNLKAERDFSASVWELAASRPQHYIGIAVAMSNAWYLGAYRNPDEAVRAAGGWNRSLEPVKFLEGHHHPRYYFASQLVSIRDRHEFVRQLATLRFSKQAAFIHEPAFVPATGKIRAVREWSNGATIDVDATDRAFLVMSVTPHKYWRVTIDGRETRALVTNIGFQGVDVPKGRHVVEMRYHNPLVTVGGGISVCTLLVLALLVWRRSFAPR